MEEKKVWSLKMFEKWIKKVVNTCIRSKKVWYHVAFMVAKIVKIHEKSFLFTLLKCAKAIMSSTAKSVLCESRQT